MELRAPTIKEEVRSFLGLVTNQGKFIPELRTKTEPLRALITKDLKFGWTATHQKCFDSLEQALPKLPTLSYFYPQRRTQLIADVSPVALGTVPLQFNEKDNPRVISFASKSLSEVEKRYPQTEKESLALVWASHLRLFLNHRLSHRPEQNDGYYVFKPSSLRWFTDPVNITLLTHYRDCAKQIRHHLIMKANITFG